MSTQTPTAYIEITLEQTATEYSVPATLYYHQEKKVFLKPIDLSRMLELCWEKSAITLLASLDTDKHDEYKNEYFTSILNPNNK